MRQDHTIEGALLAKQQSVSKYKKKKNKDFDGTRVSSTSTNAKGNWKKSYPPCQHCRNKGHPPFRCWKRLDAKCSECNQMGHEAIIFKFMNQPHGEVAKVVDPDEEVHEEEYLFVDTCFSSIESSQNWLIDSGCTNHMTNNKDLFKELSNASTLKVQVENGKYITVNGK